MAENFQARKSGDNAMEKALVMHCLAGSKDNWTLTEIGKPTKKHHF